MKWKDIPLEARRYILYHTIISPLLIAWYMLPAYMLITGYSILEVGIVFTLINIISVPLTYLIGKAFDRVPVRHGLILIDALEGVENVLYGLSHFFLGPLMISLGLLVGKITRIFYPLYQVAEKLLYPKERLEEVFAWHMRLPLLSEAIGFIVLGYIFGVMFPKPIHYAWGFIAIGLSSFFTVMYLMKYLPRLDVEERIADRFEFRFDREFRSILAIEALDILALYLAPEIVLINYMMIELGMSFFQVMLVVALSILASLPATHLSERILPKHRFKVIALYFVLRAGWALIMFLVPNFFAILVANIMAEFGNTLALPFYRSWIFSKVPSDRAGSILAGISSFERLIGLVAPFVAGALASLYPTLPYLTSLVLFLATIPILLSLERSVKEMEKS
ncbi:MAG: MFS transporter [Euryarchaeota archaeon]|nr:MFS transporter [Euryarchaeota archaeon]